MPSLKKEKKTEVVYVKMGISEYNIMLARADKYCKGNISDWIRYSSQLEPIKKDVEASKDE